MIELATLAGGCFWCTEAIFRRLNGVTKVTSGFTGGTVANPSYEQVCSGKTGHAEAIQVEFDPEIITYETLLEVFFATHDPTSLNRQGYDVGTEYRSAIFYHSEKQKEVALSVKSKIAAAVTEITPYDVFYPAEIDQQRYYEINAGSSYCQIIIDPKLQTLLEQYGEFVKPDYK
jgi:peptide-methionine (S)-S-oxide reductase